jgi:hypothetical protein
MTDYEKAAMEAAFDRWLHDGSPYTEGAFAAGWNAARAYEPPAVCGERGAGGGLRCVLHTGHDCDHRTEINRFGTYIGWPREQEPDPDERCVGLGYINGIKFKTRCGVPRREHMYVSSHAFISAKEATK